MHDRFSQLRGSPEPEEWDEETSPDLRVSLPVRPSRVPPSPYPRLTSLRPGQLLRFHVELPSIAWHSLQYQRVTAPPSERDGSVLGGSGVVEGLDYWVCPSVPALESWARKALLPRVRGRLQLARLALEVLPLEGKQLASVNLLTRGQSYEWHYDSHPLTAILFVEGAGALCYLDEAGVLQQVEPEPGLVVLGDFSQTLHCVSRVSSERRVSVPFGFGVPGHTQATSGGYIYQAHCEHELARQADDEPPLRYRTDE